MTDSESLLDARLFTAPRRAATSMNETGRQVMRFAIAGVAGLLVDVSVLYLARAAGAGWYLGRAMSFLAAVYVTWQINRRFTFAAAGHSRWREWWRYLGAMSGGGAVNYLAYGIVVALLREGRWLPLIAVSVGSLAGMSVNFIAAKLFVFKRPH